MDAFTAYNGHLAAEANGFHLNEEIVKDVFLESLKNTARSEMLTPLMKNKDEENGKLSCLKMIVVIIETIMVKLDV